MIAVIGAIIGGILNRPYIIPKLFPNSPPSLTSLSADPESPQPAGSTIEWTAKALDRENDILVYNFILKNANTGSIIKKRGWNSDRDWAWVTTESDSGNYIVEAWVKDGHHATKVDESDDQSSVEYTIASNTPPSFTSLSADPESPQPAGSTIEWTARAKDPERDDLAYNFILKDADTGSILKKSGWGSDRDWTWVTTDSNSGDYIVEAWVRDGHHATQGNEWDDQSSDIYTLKNGWPIYITNSCNKTINVILRYKSPASYWIVDGIWEIEPNTSSYLNNDSDHIRTNYDSIYLYAYTFNKSIAWAGTIEFPSDFTGSAHQTEDPFAGPTKLCVLVFESRT